jgi:hypothetical protein
VYDKHGSRNPAREGVRRRKSVSSPIAVSAPDAPSSQGSFDF